jgi:hypothetical protein
MIVQFQQLRYKHFLTFDLLEIDHNDFYKAALLSPGGFAV